MWMASTFLGSGWAPLASYTVPKNVTVLHFTLLTIEDKTMLTGCIHEVVQVLIMVFIIFSMNDNIICNSYDSFTAFQNLVHHPLKDILGT